MSPGRRAVFALAGAEIVSLVGTRLSMIAIPWLVLATTGDPVLTGLVGFAEMLPYVVVKALAGPLLDRLGARRIAIVADLASMLIVAMVPLLHALGGLGIATLLPIVVLLGAMRGPADAAKQAMVPAIAAGAGLPLERVTGVMGTVERLGGALGAAGAGALVASIGAASALAVNVATCALSAIVVLVGLPAVRVAAATGSSYLGDLREGWRHFHSDPVLVGIVLMIAFTNLFDQAFAAVLVPVWASIAGNAAVLGLLFAIFSAASVGGSALATLTAERLPRLAVYTIAFLVTGAPRFLVFVGDTPFALIALVLAVAGFASGFLNPIISAVMFERIPPALTGRVSALVNAMGWALLPFGGLVGGALVAWLGLPAAFTLMAAGYLAATMLPLALPGFRSFASRMPAQGAGAGSGQ